MRSFCPAHIRKLKPYVPGEQPRAAGLVKLNTNENPYPPSPRVFRALAGTADERLRLYPDPVSLSLRKAIARKFRCGVQNVFVGNGSDEILSLCLKAFAGEGRLVQFPDPSYSLYPVLTQIQNGRPRAVAFDGSYRLPADKCVASAAVTFVANPNAPSGTFIAPSALSRLARRLRGVLVIDEAYADFAPGNCAALFRRHRNVLICRSFSKSYSLAGLRVGFALGHPGLIAALVKVKDSYNLDRLAQTAAEAAFRDQPYLRRTVRKIVQTRARLSRELTRLGWEVLPSSANFVFARPPGGRARRIFAGLRRGKVLVRHFPGRRTGQYLRISIGTDKEIDFLLRALRAMEHA